MLSERCIVQNKYYHLHFVISYPFRIDISITHIHTQFSAILNFFIYWTVILIVCNFYSQCYFVILCIYVHGTASPKTLHRIEIIQYVPRLFARKVCEVEIQSETEELNRIQWLSKAFSKSLKSIKQDWPDSFARFSAKLIHLIEANWSLKSYFISITIQNGRAIKTTIKYYNQLIESLRDNLDFIINSISYHFWDFHFELCNGAAVWITGIYFSSYNWIESTMHIFLGIQIRLCLRL